MKFGWRPTIHPHIFPLTDLVLWHIVVATKGSFAHRCEQHRKIFLAQYPTQIYQISQKNDTHDTYKFFGLGHIEIELVRISVFSFPLKPFNLIIFHVVISEIKIKITQWRIESFIKYHNIIYIICTICMNISCPNLFLFLPF